MENQLELLFDKITEKMAIQTKEITESVTKSIMKTLEEKMAVVLDENKELKNKVNTLENKIKYLEEEKRRNNLILFGVKESEQTGSLIDYIRTVIERETNITIHPHEINNAYRLGAKEKPVRPLLVSFTSTWKKNQILRSKKNYTPGFYIKEDYSKEILEKRKTLIPELIQLRESGKIAYIKKDTLIVKDKKEINDAKRKRDQIESPNKSPQQSVKLAPKKINKTNIFNYVARSRSASVTEAKNQ